jgi:thioester reductase-like protein
MVLLTGVTGYLGAFVLEELLKQTKWRVMCLIRAENDEAAIQKLLKHLQKLEVKLEESDMDRVGIILGDLSKHKLGMSEAEYAQYIDAVDEIFHVGAWVNGILPYAVLRPTNVLGTVELIRFALSGNRNRKVFHYVSTLSTMNPFTSEKYNRFITERSITASQADYFRNMGGYPLSKLVSEVLLTAVADKILDFRVFIYRPGSISGHSKTGAANIEAYINKLMCGIIKLGFYPVSRTSRYQKDWAPVDYVAGSMVHIARRGPVYGIFHMNHPYSIYSFSMERLAKAMRSFGYPVEPLSYNKWRRKLYKDMEREDDPNPLKPLRSYFDGNLQHDLCFECKNTQMSLKNDTDSPKCPFITDEIVHRYLQYWIRQGVIPKPEELVERYNSLKKSI